VHYPKHLPTADRLILRRRRRLARIENRRCLWYTHTIREVCWNLYKISPTGDLAFKKVLASEENKDILRGLIKDFYFFVISEDDLVIENPYSIDTYKEYVEDKEVSILRHTAKDIAVSFNPLKDVAASLKRADFIMEMQIKKARFFEERFLYYPFMRFCQNYGKVGFMETGSDGKLNRYSSLRPVYALNIIKPLLAQWSYCFITIQYLSHLSRFITEIFDF
jgi:hypothetical protein